MKPSSGIEAVGLSVVGDFEGLKLAVTLGVKDLSIVGVSLAIIVGVEEDSVEGVAECSTVGAADGAAEGFSLLVLLGATVGDKVSLILGAAEAWIDGL